MRTFPLLLVGLAGLVLSSVPHPPAAAQPADVITAWNEQTVALSFAEDQFFTFKGHRALAMLHLAMHDVLNTIEPRYTRYACQAAPVDADPVAAAAQAAFEVLATQYPSSRDTLAASLQQWLDAVPDGVRKARARALGRACAATILALRTDDGWDADSSYAFRSEPGQYQTTGTWGGRVHKPGFRYAHPFGLLAPDQFRPPPPPALASPAYTAAYAEVRAHGHANSPSRTADQTGYAVWWMEFAEGAINRLARQLVADWRPDLWTTARLFAHLNVALYDGYIAVWDAKYEHNHWRPETAIHAADGDGNPDTHPDAAWTPLRPTPPFQDYASAHATACAASLGVLADAFGDATPFTMTTTTAPPDMPTRSFESFSAAAEECADSRIQLGWHFRYAADEGLVLGQRVHTYLRQTLLVPTAPPSRTARRE